MSDEHPTSTAKSLRENNQVEMNSLQKIPEKNLDQLHQIEQQFSELQQLVNHIKTKHISMTNNTESIIQQTSTQIDTINEVVQQLNEKQEKKNEAFTAPSSFRTLQNLLSSSSPSTSSYLYKEEQSIPKQASFPSIPASIPATPYRKSTFHFKNEAQSFPIPFQDELDVSLPEQIPQESSSVVQVENPFPIQTTIDEQAAVKVHIEAPKELEVLDVHSRERSFSLKKLFSKKK